MAPNNSTGYVVVDCQGKADEPKKRVCIPRSWVLFDKLPGGKVAIVYPTEDESHTAIRIKNNEPPGVGWETYIGVIETEIDSYQDAVSAFIGTSGNQNINQNDAESRKCRGTPNACIDSFESPVPSCSTAIAAASPDAMVTHKDSYQDAVYAFPGTSGNQNDAESRKCRGAPNDCIDSFESPATGVACVPSCSAAIAAASSDAMVTPKDEFVTEARDSLIIKFNLKELKSETLEKNKKLKKLRKYVKRHAHDKSNKTKHKNVQKQEQKNNNGDFKINPGNTLLDSNKPSVATEPGQDEPKNKHIFTKRLELKIDDIMISKNNSVLSKAKSENIEKEVDRPHRNLSPDDMQQIINLQNKQNDNLMKITKAMQDLRILASDIKGLYVQITEDKETLHQIILKTEDHAPLPGVPLQEANDQNSYIHHNERLQNEDMEDEESDFALVYEEDEVEEEGTVGQERVGEEIHNESDVTAFKTKSIEYVSPPSSPEFIPKTVERNNTWTLKYPNPGKDLIQLGSSRVYVPRESLRRCLETSHDVRTFARELYKEVFTQEALERCSMTGQKPFVGKRKTSSPALHRDAQIEILKCAMKISQIRGWETVERQVLLQSIRGMLFRWRGGKPRNERRRRSERI